MSDVPVLILAAGASSRMRGRDKLLEEVGGIPLVRRQALLALGVSGDVRVALPPLPHPRADALTGLGVRIVPVADAADGMGASLRAIFSTLAAEPRALLLLGDLPALEETDLRAVLRAPAVAPEALLWRGATQDGRGGHPLLVAAALYPEFRALSGDDGGRAIVNRAGAAVHLVPLPGQRARLDLDTPEAWAAWRAGHA